MGDTPEDVVAQPNSMKLKVRMKIKKVISTFFERRRPSRHVAAYVNYILEPYLNFVVVFHICKVERRLASRFCGF